jgi:F-type H+-transporting ATPase subunit b
MVVLNFTLLVELGLFLIFLWGCNALVFRPVLGQLDTREEKIAGDLELALREEAQADALKQEYTRQIAGVRRAVSEEFRQARQAAQQEQDLRIAQLKKQMDEEVQVVRAQAHQQVEEQRPQCERLVPEVAAEVARKLGLGNGS